MYEELIKISFLLFSFSQNESGLTEPNKNSKYEILPNSLWGGQQFSERTDVTKTGILHAFRICFEN